MRLGDKDEALKWLQRSYDSHEGGMTIDQWPDRVR